jgi:type III secretion protein V
VISLLEVPVVEAEIPEGHDLALASPDLLAASGISGVPATDPATNEPAVFVGPRVREAVLALGVALVDPAAVIARHVGRVASRRASDFVGLQETQSLLDQLDRTQPALVRNVVPKPVPLPLLADVLRRLVEERVSIRPLREILEALALHAPTEKDPLQLTELVRAALRRQITYSHATGGQLGAFLVDPSVEETVREAIQRTASGTYLALAPDVARDIVEAARAELADAAPPIVVLTQADVRRFLRRLLETELPDVTVLSYQELVPEVVVQPLGRIRP